jgi:hypothetical protein
MCEAAQHGLPRPGAGGASRRMGSIAPRGCGDLGWRRRTFFFLPSASASASDARAAVTPEQFYALNEAIQQEGERVVAHYATGDSDVACPPPLGLVSLNDLIGGGQQRFRDG